MDGLCRAVGGRVDIRLAGRLYWLKPLTLGDLASAEFHLLAKRQNPVERARRALSGRPQPEAVQQMVLSLAEDEIRRDRSHRVVRSEELLAWLLSAGGQSFVVFQCLEKRPGVPKFKSWGKARRWVHALPDAERQELSRRVEMVSGFDVLSRLEWQDSARGAASRFVPWKRLVKNLIEAFYYAPEDLRQLTLTQIRILYTDAKDLGGTKRLTGKAAQTFARSGFRDAKRWLRSSGGMTPARQAFHRLMEERRAKRGQSV